MLLWVIRFWWIWISRKVKSNWLIKIISAWWCSTPRIWTILSFPCRLQGWNLFTRWIFNKRAYQERVKTSVYYIASYNLYDLNSSNLTLFDPKTEMFTVCRIQNASAGRRYFQCNEQEGSFKQSFSKVWPEMTSFDLKWPGTFRSNLGLCWKEWNHVYPWLRILCSWRWLAAWTRYDGKSIWS